MNRRWNLKQKIQAIERELIRQAIGECPSREQARLALGLSKQGMMNKLRRYGFPIETRVACPTCGHAAPGRPLKDKR